MTKALLRPGIRVIAGIDNIQRIAQAHGVQKMRHSEAQDTVSGHCIHEVRLPRGDRSQLIAATLRARRYCNSRLIGCTAACHAYACKLAASECERSNRRRVANGCSGGLCPYRMRILGDTVWAKSAVITLPSSSGKELSGYQYNVPREICLCLFTNDPSDEPEAADCIFAQEIESV